MGIDFAGNSSNSHLNPGIGSSTANIRTVSFWLRAPDWTETHDQSILGALSGGWNGSWFIDTLGDIGVYWLFSGTDLSYRWTTSLTDGQWHHILIINDYGDNATAPIVIVDGTQLTASSSQNPTGTVNETNGILIAGEGGSDIFKGQVAEVATWDRLISGAERAALALGLVPLFFVNGLVSYAPLIRSLRDPIQGTAWTNTNGTQGYAHPSIKMRSSPPIESGQDRALSATAAAVSGAIADLSATRGLAAAVAGISGASGALSAARGLDAAVAGVSGASADLSASRALGATVSAVSGGDSALSATRGLTATITGQSGAAADLAVARALAAAVAGVSGASADLTVTGGVVSLVASVVVTSGGAAALTVSRALNAVVTALSGGSANTSVLRSLSGAAVGQSGANVTLRMARALTSLVSAQSGGGASLTTFVSGVGRQLIVVAAVRTSSTHALHRASATGFAAQRTSTTGIDARFRP